MYVVSMYVCTHVCTHVCFLAPIYSTSLQNPNDVEERVSMRIEKYKRIASSLAEFFQTAQHVNGDQDSHAVFECLDSLLVQPMINTP